MDDLKPLEFDLPGFVRVLRTGTGDGRYSAATSARNTGGVARSVEALRSFTGQLKANNVDGAQILSAYLAQHPRGEHLFAPLWLTGTNSAAVAAGLDALLAATKLRTLAQSLLSSVARHHAPAVAHVLANDRTFLARRALVLLHTAVDSNPQVAAAIVRRYDLNGAARTLTTHYSPCRVPFINLITALLKTVDRDALRTLITTRTIALVSAAWAVSDIANGFHRDLVKHNENEDEKESNQPKQRQRTNPVLLRTISIKTSLEFLHIVQDHIMAASDTIVREACESRLLHHVSTTAAARTPLRRETQTGRIFLNLRETAINILLSACNRRAIRPFLVARALVDAQVDQGGVALDFVLRIVGASPRVARVLLSTGPHLSAQPMSGSAWLAHASVILACTRQLSRPTDVFSTASFFERAFSHRSNTVRVVATAILVALCFTVRSAADAECLPPFSWVRNAILRGKWPPGAHIIIATYRTWAPVAVLQEGFDAVKSSLDNASELRDARPVLLAAVNTDGVTALPAIFSKKNALNNLLESGEIDTVKAVFRTSGVFGKGSRAELALDIWLACLTLHPDARSHLPAFVGQAWKQPYSLFDDTTATTPDSKNERRAPLIVAAAVRKSMKNVEGDGPFETYIAKVLSTLAAADCIFGESTTRTLVQAKLSSESKFKVELFNGNHQGTNVRQAVSLLEDIPVISPSLRELQALARIIRVLYDYDGALYQDEMSRFCSMLQDGLGISCADERFFNYHSKFLAPTESEKSCVIRSLLRRIVTRSGSRVLDLSDNAVSAEERAVFIRYSLGSADSETRHRAVAEALSIFNQVAVSDTAALAIFGDALLNAICKLEHVLVKDVRSFVQSTIERSKSVQSQNDKKERYEWAQLTFRVLDAFFTHKESKSIIDSLVQSDKLDKDALCRLGISTGLCFIAVLKKFTSLIPDVVTTVRDIVNDDQQCDFVLQLFQVLSFLASEKNELDSEFLTTVAVEKPWNMNVDSVTVQLKQAAFDFGRRAGSSIDTDKAIDSVLSNLPGEQESNRAVWWACVCGVISHHQLLSSHGQNVSEKARKLVKIIASQLPQDNPPISFRGPLELVVHLLRIANIPQGYLPPGSADHEFATNLCEFATGLFKATSSTFFRSLFRIDTNEEMAAMRELTVLLQCVAIAVRIREVSLNLSRLALHTFGTELLKLQLIADSGNSNGRNMSVREELLKAMVDVVESSVGALRTVGMDARSATAMTKMEELFSSEKFPFHASPSMFDGKVIRIMSAIKSCMQKNDFRRERELPNPRSGLFAPLAAYVAPKLSADRLNLTAECMFNSVDDDIVSTVFPKLEEEKLPYNPEFVLKTLRLACEYAAYTKEATFLDMNMVANGGLLRVAIMGTASENESVRVQAYAALDALSRALGPEFGKTQESAAGLYVYRRPLAFVLQVFKDSIEEPLKQVLPLFASWLWHVLRVMLRPSHNAYMPVMRHLLRAPVLDTDDCAGVVHLLRNTEVGSDVKALRLLAFDVMEHGIWTRKDHLVARKRRLYECLLMLSGSSLGIDSLVRDRALRLLATLPPRFPNGQVAIQLCRMHAFGTCLVPQGGDEDECKLGNLMLRLQAISNVASSLPDEYDQSHHAMCMAAAVRRILRLLITGRNQNFSEDDMNNVTRCIDTLSRLSNDATMEWKAQLKILTHLKNQLTS